MASIYDQLPFNLNAEEVAEFMGISRAKAYTLMHSEGFPTIHLGKRMMVSREKLLEWLEEHTAKAEQ
jgi:excisionase family DNA binding protein